MITAVPRNSEKLNSRPAWEREVSSSHDLDTPITAAIYERGYPMALQGVTGLTNKRKLTQT